MKRAKKGQSVLEYVIILTAIVAGVIAGLVLFGQKDEADPKGLSKIMKKAGTKITDASTEVKTIVP